MIKYSFAQPTKSLYIHWPFCANKCHYCDFISFEQHEQFYEIYHKALCNEITHYAHERPVNASHVVESIFLGGGTPSLYPGNLLQSLFALLHDFFTIDKGAEVTIEANPADITEENLTLWKTLGINRLSLGIQVLDDKVLLQLNRRQRVADAQRALKLAPRFFSNISVDLILGLPGTTERIWFDTLGEVVTWPLTHISLYFLTIYEKTPLFFRLERGELSSWPEEQLIRNYEQSIQLLAQNGFEQYEISNFSRPGFASRHNVAYWDRLPYRGFGLAASSFDGLSRFVNEKNLGKYIQAISSGDENVFCSSERLLDDQLLMEILMLGLRQKKGVDLRDVLYFLKDEQQQKFYQNIAQLKEQALLEEEKGVIRLTTKGFILENEIVLRLL